MRSNSIGRMLRAKHVLPTLRPPAPKHRPSLKTVRFQRSRSVRNRREPCPRRPCEAPPTQAACQRGVRGPARRMESSPAPGSLWFLSPAGKELVRPQTHETPSSHTLIFGCVPPPLIPPKPNPPSLNEERHFEHMFRMPLFPIYLFIFHYTPKKVLLPEKPPPPIPTHRKGRGGAVSRRDHNPLAGNHPHLSGGTNSEEAAPPNASRSSGEGVWGRGASLREAASPPESPTPQTSSGGSARGGASRREAASLAYLLHFSSVHPLHTLTQPLARLRRSSSGIVTRTALLLLPQAG